MPQAVWIAIGNAVFAVLLAGILRLTQQRIRKNTEALEALTAEINLLRRQLEDNAK